MRILALPRYSTNGPSSRVRLYNYLPYLKQAVFDVEMAPCFDPGYIENLFTGRKKNFTAIIKSYFRRICLLLKSKKYQILWLQYELLPWVPFWVEKLYFSGCNMLVIDYDDAVFDRYRNHPSAIIRWFLGKKIARLMALASVVVVGNQYLADYAQECGARNIVIIPSVIELEKYLPRQWKIHNQKPLQIGWIGSPSTVNYLLLIKDAIIASIAENCEWIIIGADIPNLLQVPGVTSRAWSIENEAELLQSLDVGVMPLVDDTFEKGKCGYKLIQYMACGLPVVASPVGVNIKIVKHGTNGFLAASRDEWEKAFKALQDIQLRARMGREGRKLIEDIYNYSVQSKVLIKTFQALYVSKRELF